METARHVSVAGENGGAPEGGAASAAADEGKSSGYGRCSSRAEGNAD
jgi:hypothetical protein